MIIKNIKYTDYNGVERNEQFMFHLSSPDYVRLQAKLGKDDIQEAISELVAKNDMVTILEVLEYIILNSYGEKSQDGKTFLKTKEVRESFEYSQAYAELFEELISNPETMKNFALGITNLKSDKPTISKFEPKKED